MSEHEDIIAGLSEHEHPLFKVDDWFDYDALASLEETGDVDEANIITSQIKGQRRHTIMLDLDVPAKLVPSTTEGHSHLYIDVTVNWPTYRALLDALQDAGVIQPGYNSVSQRRGFTALRLPWVKKEKRVEEEAAF